MHITAVAVSHEARALALRVLGEGRRHRVASGNAMRADVVLAVVEREGATLAAL